MELIVEFYFDGFDPAVLEGYEFTLEVSMDTTWMSRPAWPLRHILAPRRTSTSAMTSISEMFPGQTLGPRQC